MNATKHGLAGQTVVLPGEDLAAFQALRKRFFNETRPVGILEEQCVEMMANKSWLLARADALQTNLFAQGQIKHAHRTETDDPRLHVAMTAVHTLIEHVGNLEKLTRYQHRHHRMYQDNFKQLRELQAERRQLEASARRKAAWAADDAADRHVSPDAGVDKPVSDNHFPPSGSESQPPPQPAPQAPDPPSLAPVDNPV
jgi:hypothetical protein